MRDPEKEYENAQDVQMDMKRAQESNQLATNLQPCKQDDLISRQAAIDVLDRNHILGQGLLNDTLDHIADAIMALPSAQPETHDKRTKTHSCDCISRQAAMEEISKQQTYKMFEGEDTLYLDANDVGSVLASLPSAQPEPPTDDCISKQAVIDAIRKWKRYETTEGLIDRINNLPYAQPDLSGYSDKLWRNAYERGKAEAQRKKGMWIEHNPHKWGLGIVFKCSECGEKIDCEPSNYCPNCGAEMEDPEDIPMEYFENGGR